MKKLFIAISFLNMACVDMESTDCYTYMNNETGHHIAVKSYFLGEHTPFLSFELLPYEKKQVMYRRSRGLGSGESYPLLATGQDSNVVIFNNKDTIIHYIRPEIVNPAKKYIVFESPRNLFNLANYVKKTIKKTAYKRVYHYTYTFTEQDFLDASQ